VDEDQGAKVSLLFARGRTPDNSGEDMDAYDTGGLQGLAAARGSRVGRRGAGWATRYRDDAIGADVGARHAEQTTRGRVTAWTMDNSRVNSGQRDNVSQRVYI
jgi:hypothetical protein